jgi:hypothetical protein
MKKTIILTELEIEHILSALDLQIDMEGDIVDYSSLIKKLKGGI